MFPLHYFAPRYLAPEYFPEHGTVSGHGGFRGAGRRRVLHHIMVQQLRKAVVLRQTERLTLRLEARSREEALRENERQVSRKRKARAMYSILLSEA